MMQRVITYIDGFNLYFGLKQAGLKRYYWLDVAALGQRICSSRGKPWWRPITLPPASATTAAT